MKRLGLLNFIASKIRGSPERVDLKDFCTYLTGDIYVRELAFWSCVNLVANVISKCEFRTFSQNEEVKDREYYLWNIAPNRNQNSSGFIHEWIATLYRKNECLVVGYRDQLLVADSYIRNRSVLGDTFEHVQVGDHEFHGTLSYKDVLFYELGSMDMRRLLIGLYDSYKTLIASGMNDYRSTRGKKAVFSYDAIPVAGSEEKTAFDQLINERLKTFLQADNAAIPVGKGQSITEYGVQRVGNKSTSRDIRAMIDDVSDFTARAFVVPPALLNGAVQDTSKAVDQMLTFCIDPLCDMLQEEINRKRNGYDGFRRGNRLYIDTRTVKHVDLLGMAPNIDKLISSGCYCINDIRVAAGDVPINEPWAYEHFITRNYTTIEQALAALTGGDGN